MLGRTAFVAGALALALTGPVWGQTATLAAPGKVVHIDSNANVVMFEDGRMFHVNPHTTLLVNDQAVRLEQLQPGSTVIVRSGDAVTLANGQYVGLEGAPLAAAPAATQQQTTVTTTTVTTTPAPAVVSDATGTIARYDAPSSIVTLSDGRMVALGPKSVVRVNDRPISSALIAPGMVVTITGANPVVERDGRAVVLNQGVRDADNGGAMTWDSKYAGYEADIGHAGMQVQGGG